MPTLDPSVGDYPALLPNIYDPSAKDAQKQSPGYRASNVQYTPYGFTASLVIAGDASNVYGTDIKDLSLVVEHQSINRLSIKIMPSYLVCIR